MNDYFQGFYILSTPISNRKEIIKKNLIQADIKGFEFFDFTPCEKIDNNGSNPNFLSILNHSSNDITSESIANNHYSLIETALKRGLDNVIIFEDDAMFDLPLDNNKIKSITDWLSKNSWDIFYFGYCPWPLLFTFPITKDIVKPMSPLCAHCYAVSKKGMISILKDRKRKIGHIDKIYSESDMEKYAIFPAISFQNIDPSLYRQSGIPISFRNMSRTLEYTSITLPIIILLLIILIVVKIVYKSKNNNK